LEVVAVKVVSAADDLASVSNNIRKGRSVLMMRPSLTLGDISSL
jgi:hypothetical protein